MKIYKVGGCVRDALLGVQPKDYDYLVVGSTEEEMLSLGFDKVGADFPVFIDDKGEEYALARRERKVGSGYLGFMTEFTPDVTVEEDLMRRDLTINSIAYDPETANFVDPYGGLSDLHSKILRATSEAFCEDPVRILRLGRFWSRLGPDWDIDDATIMMCIDMVERGECKFLTKERVIKELLNALKEPHHQLFFQLLEMVGLNLDHFWMLKIDEPIEGPVRKRFAVACTQDAPKFFVESWRLPNDIAEYATMVKKLNAADTCSLVDLLYHINGFKKEKYLLQICEDFEDHAHLKEVLDFCKTIHLSEEDLALYKGPELGNRLYEKRKNAYEEKC